jgi:hypothetical protein
MTKKRTLLILCAAFLVSVRCEAQGTFPDSVDAGMLAVLRSVVLDSLRGAGARGNQLTIASDSASAALLRAAQLPISAAPQDGVFCPDGSSSAGARLADPVGYRVSVRIGRDREREVWALSVSKSCTFIYRGRHRGFRESGTWELVRQHGRWILGRTLERSIT